MVTDEVPGNIADEVPGNTVNGTAIINCSANYRSVIGYKIAGNITDGATVKYCTAFSSRIPDKISGIEPIFA